MPLLAVEIPLLNDIVIIFGLSILVIFVFNKIKIPPIVGFLLTGIIAGPYGLGLVKAKSEVEILAEIGVILILFAIGLEFSIGKLMRIRRNILLGGSAQVLLTIAAFFMISFFRGSAGNEAIFIGFLTALSSTAIILKLFQSKALMDSPQGKIGLSILIFQDIIILPMFLLTPILAGQSGDITTAILILIGKVVGIIVFLYVSIKYIMPGLIYNVAKTRIKEMFILSILVICLFIVWLSALAGISLALGAFLAGLIISETDYSTEAISFVEPFRDVFSSFFFVSIGMLLNINFFIENITFVLSVTGLIILIKFFTASGASLILGYPIRISIIVGLSLAQIGEFSFVLSKFGLDVGLIDENFYQRFLAVAVLSMSVTPFIFELAPKLAEKLSRTKLLKKLDKKDTMDVPEEFQSMNHLVIIGYGLNGSNLAKVSKASGIEYVIIEMNPETVKHEKAKGEPIFYGDATKEGVLHHAGVDKARVCVIAISDPVAIRKIAETVKHENPEIYLIVRTRYVQEVDALYKLGADEVIPEEFETSVEIFTRVLNRYLVPREQISKFISEIRSDGYKIFRSLDDEANKIDLMDHIPNYEICTIKVKSKSDLAGKSLSEIRLRELYDVTLLAIKRGEELIPNPAGNSFVKADDTLVLFGNPESLDKSVDIFK